MKLFSYILLYALGIAVSVAGIVMIATSKGILNIILGIVMIVIGLITIFETAVG